MLGVTEWGGMVAVYDYNEAPGHSGMASMMVNSNGNRTMDVWNKYGTRVK